MTTTPPAVSETPETKEDYEILTAWLAVNDPNKPSLRVPVKCIRLTTYERLERRLLEAEAKLGEAVELERMRLAAISVATLMNSRHSEPPLQRDHVYWTQSYQDTLDAVGREIEWRERAEAAERGKEGG